MRLLQNFLIVIGFTALGLGVGGYGLYMVMSSVLTEPRGESFGGAHIWLGVILCGGVLGGFAGFAAAVARIARHDTRIWSAPVWIGLALGLAVGLLLSLHSSVRIEPWFWCIRAAFFMSACSTAGALLARIGMSMLQRPKKRR